MKKIISFLLVIVIFLTGCSIIFDTSNSSSIISNPNNLELLSFEIKNDENDESSVKKNKKKDDSKFYINLTTDENVIIIEAVVKNEKRLSFVDMVLFISFLNTQVVFNEGNGDYICSTETERKDNIWVTNIYVNINVDTKLYHDGYVEVNEICFLDTGSKKINTDITKVESKKIEYHCHFGYTMIEDVEATCVNEGYTSYMCDGCLSEFKTNKESVNPNNHKGNKNACKYCGKKENGYKYKSGDEIIENIEFKSFEDNYDLNSLLEDYQNVILFFLPMFDYEYVIEKVNDMFNCDKVNNIFIGLHYDLNLINTCINMMDFPVVHDLEEKIRNMFEFNYMYGDSVVINREKQVSIVPITGHGYILDGLKSLAEKCNVDIVELFHSIKIENIIGKYYIDENNIMEITEYYELIFYNIKLDGSLEIKGETYNYIEKIDNRLYFENSTKDKLSIYYYEGTDSFIIEGTEKLYAYDYYSYNLKNELKEYGYNVEEVLASHDSYEYVRLEEALRGYYVYSNDHNEEALIIQCSSPYEIVEKYAQNNIEMYNCCPFYYYNLTTIWATELLFNEIRSIFQKLPKDNLPIDINKYLDVCPLEEGTSSLNYLISYMSYKGYSIMSKENGYSYCFEQDFESVANQLLETFSSIQVEDTQGNIIKELECVDCFVFYKEDADALENNKYAVVLITEDNDECFYDVIGNVYFIKYGYYDVMGDIYGALETWKVNN